LIYSYTDLSALQPIAVQIILSSQAAADPSSTSIGSVFIFDIQALAARTTRTTITPCLILAQRAQTTGRITGVSVETEAGLRLNII
jgi:hypothetical protein